MLSWWLKPGPKAANKINEQKDGSSQPSCADDQVTTKNSNWNSYGHGISPDLLLVQVTRIALFLLGELVAALRSNSPDAFKCWLSGGVQELGEPLVEELLLDWLDPFLTVEEQDRLLDWHIGVNL